jgi:hypothetical protein
MSTIQLGLDEHYLCAGEALLKSHSFQNNCSIPVESNLISSDCELVEFLQQRLIDIRREFRYHKYKQNVIYFMLADFPKKTLKFYIYSPNTTNYSPNSQ